MSSRRRSILREPLAWFRPISSRREVPKRRNAPSDAAPRSHLSAGTIGSGHSPPSSIASRIVNLYRIRQNVLIEGRPALTALRAVRWAGHCVLRRPATIRIGNHGPLMTVQPRLHSFGSTSLFMKREAYEPSLQMFTSFIRPGDVVLDIGANYGVYALLAATAAGPDGMVHCFEPGTASLQQLQHNLALNPDLLIAVHALAPSDVSGTARLYHVGGSPTTFSLGHELSAGAESVTKVTLDAWAESANVPRVRAIKMDVEGHEPNVIRGGLRLMATHQPVLMFEISREALRRNGSTEDELWSLVTDLGYSIYRLEYGRLVLAAAPGNGNHFALPSGSSARATRPPFHRP